MISREEAVEKATDVLEEASKGVCYVTEVDVEWLITAIEALSQPPADQWLPCSERLPDKGGTYLVTQERYRLDDRLYKKPVAVETTFAEFNFMDDVWNRARHLKVIAWMPLPEPYKGE